MSSVSSVNLTEASVQWATRPDDQRFLSLDDLRQSVESRKRESWTTTQDAASLRIIPDGDAMRVQVRNNTRGEDQVLDFSNWSFSQLCALGKSPAAYLRGLPAPIASIPLQYSLEHKAERERALILGQSNGSQVLRAVTSPTYGRIWDLDVVQAVERVNSSGRWKVPAASYATSNPKRATTLYASDRDVFIFLVDPDSQIDVGGGRCLHRGFFTWNSEVGAATFGLTTFLYDRVCDNRIIWGATEIKELKIRHTGGAPERFMYEGARYLSRYAEESIYETVEVIKRAQAYELPRGKKDSVEDWLTKRGFTAAVAKSSVAAADQEEGGARSLMDIVNGITAYARGFKHTDARVDLETKAGKLLELVSGK